MLSFVIFRSTLYFTLRIRSTLDTTTLLHTPHSTLLYTLHNITICNPQSTFYTSYCTLHTWDSRFCTTHSTSTLEPLHSPLHTFSITLCTLYFKLYAPNPKLCNLNSTLHTLHFTLCTSNSTLYTWHSTFRIRYSKLYNPTPRISHSALKIKTSLASEMKRGSCKKAKVLRLPQNEFQHVITHVWISSSDKTRRTK